MLSRRRHYWHTVRVEGFSLRLLVAYRAVPGTCGAIRKPGIGLRGLRRD
ncbi:MAG: hypothetical protein ACKV2U_00110 [Bryobacteraceae bacterium]